MVFNFSNKFSSFSSNVFFLFFFLFPYNFVLTALVFLNSFVIEYCIFSLYQNCVKVTSTKKSLD